jgi:hypothetical protein
MRKRAKTVRSVIKNYGLMWRRDSVFWGGHRRRGLLQGRRSGKIIDFYDQA